MKVDRLAAVETEEIEEMIAVVIVVMTAEVVAVDRVETGEVVARVVREETKQMI
jgi:hypothetical protein